MWHLRVYGHETRMNIALLLQAEAELTGDVVAVPQIGMNQDGCHTREGETIRHRKCDRNEHRGVLLVSVDVEFAVLDNKRRVVRKASVVE